MFSHGAQNGVQRSNAKVFVGRNSEALVGRLRGLQHGVAAFLVEEKVPDTFSSLSTNSSHNDEIHAMAAKAFQHGQIVNAWLCHPGASEEIVRIAGGFAGAQRG
jgi:hypothetical protein